MADIVKPKKLVEPEEHKARRLALHTLEKSVIDIGKVQFGPSELQEVNIRAVQVEFSSHDKPKLEPCFFDPYPPDLLMKPEEGDVEREFPEYGAPLPNEDIDITPINRARELSYYLTSYLHVYRSRSRSRDASSTDLLETGWGCKANIDQYGFGPLWEFDKPQWRVDSISHYCVKSVPHIKGSLIYDINGDDKTLFRGELLFLIRVMRGRMRTWEFIEHDVAPVLLFSIMGPQHARIIQGHINGNELVVYYTKFHDFRYKKNAPMDFFAQWYYCKPTGQTMSNKK